MNMFKGFSFEKNEGLNNESIYELEKNNNWVIPKFYKEILMYSNGLELDRNISLFGSKDLEEANGEIYDTSYIPEYLVIGCTAGSDVFVVEQKLDSDVLYVYDPGALFPGDQNIVIKHIEKWFLNKCPIKQEMFGKIY